MSTGRIAVCIHVYYEDMWEYISGYLRNFPDDADYFVTCREEIYPALSRSVAADFPEARIDIMPNQGMDVLPFLLQCHKRELYRYNAVLKLHTKNRKSDLRSNQGQIMLDGLCGSPALVERIEEVFETDETAGIVGSAFQLRSANALMYGNRARMQELLSFLEIDLTDWPFFTGTMFWIAGPLLRDISDLAPRFLEQAEREHQAQTGGDGTLAHALERVFGALSKAMAASVYLTDRRDSDSGEYLVVPERLHGPANSRRLLELGSSDLVRRHIEAPHWCRTIRQSEYFDPEHYAEVSKDYAVPGMDAVYHFVLYGDLLELDPGPNFSTTYYQARRPDVARQTICSLAHYLHRGHKEGIAMPPGEGDWLSLAERLGLLDPAWYAETYPDVTCSGMTPREHYRLIGQKLGRASSFNFRPSEIPVLNRPALPGAEAHLEKSVVTFLKRYYLGEEHLYTVLKRSGQNGDFSLAQMFSKRIVNRYGPSRALREALATSHTLSWHWGRAKRIWSEFWSEAENGLDSGRHGQTVLQFDRPSKPLKGFETVTLETASGPAGKPAGEGGNVCVYTTLFGDIDNLFPVLNPAEGVDYLCFTDRPREAEGWTQVIVDPKQASDNLNAKIFKILPHRYLQDYEYSMFVDANTVFLGRTGELVDLCRQGGDFVMWQHPLRDDAYTEVCAVIAHRRHGPEFILDQIRHYAEQGFPRNSGMFEASFIWRRHMAPEVSALMDQWWEEICRLSTRDQISLSYLVWKTGMRPRLLPAELGTSRDNIFFFKAPHRNGRTRPEAEVNPLLAAPALRNRKRDITFLYSEKYAASGSTVLRGGQLSELARQHYADAREVRYTTRTDIEDEILVLGKGFLKTTTPEDLRALRKRNLLIADFVDEPPAGHLVREIDMLMASSLCGYRYYLNSFPDIPAFHVTHHVDTRIPRCEEAATEGFRAGYFGELLNTIRSEEIERLVDFNLVDTSRQGDAWIGELGRYNFHYAFRQSRGIDGAKPFLKGFVAAQCGANMMIQKSAGDASFYLGADYPYLMPDDAGPAEIAEGLRHARDTLGGPEWRHGREIMREVAARSSVEHVMREFDAMLAVL